MNQIHALAAQVIPVLLLAASFESRWLQRVPDRYWQSSEVRDGQSEKERVVDGTNGFQPVAMAVVILFIGIGELIALWAVLTNTSGAWQESWVILATCVSLLIVVLPLVSLHVNDLRIHWKKEEASHSLLVFFFLLTVSLVVMALYLTSSIQSAIAPP